MSEGKSTKSRASTLGPAFSILPLAHNFSVLGNPQKFQAYITTELSLVQDGLANHGSLPMPPPLPPVKKLWCNMNSIYLNSLLSMKGERVMKGTMAWVDNNVFTESNLPVKFDADAVKTAPKL
jgi:hypothetical protein